MFIVGVMIIAAFGLCAAISLVYIVITILFPPKRYIDNSIRVEIGDFERDESFREYSKYGEDDFYF